MTYFILYPYPIASNNISKILPLSKSEKLWNYFKYKLINLESICTINRIINLQFGILKLFNILSINLNEISNISKSLVCKYIFKLFKP